MITRTTISVDEALKMVISGVLIAPHSLEISNLGKFTAYSPAPPSKNSYGHPPGVASAKASESLECFI
jgi:uncharacterized membrane protein